MSYPFQLNLHHLPDAERDACLAGLDACRANGAPPANFAEWIDRSFGASIAAIFLRSATTRSGAVRPKRWRGTGSETASPRWTRPGCATTCGSAATTLPGAPIGPSAIRARAGRAWCGGCSPAGSPRGVRIASVSGAALSISTRPSASRTFRAGSASLRQRSLSTAPLDRWCGCLISRRCSRLISTACGAPRRTRRAAARPSLAETFWTYFPESNCPFYRVSLLSRPPANVPDPDRLWSLLAEVTEPPGSPPRSRDDVVDATVQGLLATGLVPGRDRLHHTWHRRLDHGYPIPSLGRDEALARVLPALEAREVYSRGRFGAGSTRCRIRTTASRKASSSWTDGFTENPRRPSITPRRSTPAR